MNVKSVKNRNTYYDLIVLKDIKQLSRLASSSDFMKIVRIDGDEK